MKLNDECSSSYYISDAQTDISSYILRDITLPAFLNAEPHPELLILLLFSENLLPNEFIRVSSMLSLPSTPSGNIITDNQGKGTFMATLKITCENRLNIQYTSNKLTRFPYLNKFSQPHLPITFLT